MIEMNTLYIENRFMFMEMRLIFGNGNGKLWIYIDEKNSNNISSWVVLNTCSKQSLTIQDGNHHLFI